MKDFELFGLERLTFTGKDDLYNHPVYGKGTLEDFAKADVLGSIYKEMIAEEHEQSRNIAPRVISSWEMSLVDREFKKTHGLSVYTEFL